MIVGDEYRKNPLSLKEGGSVYDFYYKGGEHKQYDKIKDPKRYLDGVVNKLKLNGKNFWQLINKIYLDGELIYPKQTK